MAHNSTCLYLHVSAYIWIPVRLHNLMSPFRESKLRSQRRCLTTKPAYIISSRIVLLRFVIYLVRNCIITLQVFQSAIRSLCTHGRNTKASFNQIKLNAPNSPSPPTHPFISLYAVATWTYSATSFIVDRWHFRKVCTQQHCDASKALLLLLLSSKHTTHVNLCAI